MIAVTVLGFASTGAIAQGVSFSGSANMGVIYHGKTTEDGATKMEPRFQWLANFDLGISAEGTTDGGLTFGAATSIDGNGRGNGAASDIDDTTAYIGGESWKITIGDVDPASDKGKLLGDVGYDGLGVDDVAEHIGGADQNVEVSFALGTASLAITFGQEAGSKRIPNPEYNPGRPRSPKMTNVYAVIPVSLATYSATPGLEVRSRKTVGTIVDNGTFKVTLPGPDNSVGTADDITNEFYINADGELTLIVGDDGRDDTEANQALDSPIANDEAATAAHLDLEDNERLTQEVTDEDPGSDPMGNMYLPAGKQQTNWAAGVSFDIGSTTLGIGIDSNKLMQTSIKADLGAFSGKLFYSQQEMDNMKSTGTGVEIGVSAGENTSINAVYAQGKTGDDTSKGFGVGVSHGLGGGASLAAGFAKVEDQTKASVGVTMSF